MLYTTQAVWSFFTTLEQLGLVTDYSREINGVGNVATFYLQPYMDFGYLGTYFWTFIIALLAAIILQKTINNNNYIIIKLVCLSSINLVIFAMHNGFILRSKSFLVWILFSVVVSKVCQLKRRCFKKNGQIYLTS